MTTIAIYFLILLIIGFISKNRSESSNAYLIGNRNITPYMAGLSSEATSMSGWLLLGLPGIIFTTGISGALIALSCIVGSYLNWKFIAKKLRSNSEKTNSITLSDYLGNTKDKYSFYIKILSASVIIFFMLIYLWAQFVAIGKGLSGGIVDSGIDYNMAVIIGGIIILTYTTVGGFVSVVRTDVIQAVIIFLVLLILPLYLLSITDLTVINFIDMTTIGHEKNELFSFFKGDLNTSFIYMILSSLGIGVAYIGQPQLASRFMAINNENNIVIARRVAITWVAVSCLGVTILGILGNILLLSPPNDPELIILELTKVMLPAWISGIILVAIMSAIMSSADSFLLSAVTSIYSDLGLKEILYNINHLLIIRIVTILLGIIGILLALNTNPNNPEASVFKLATYAWGGLAIVFGVPLIYKIYSAEPKSMMIFMTMLIGVMSMLAWHLTGLNLIVYEVIPIMMIQIVFLYMASLVTKLKKS